MSHLLAVPGAVAGLLVPWTPHEPCGCSVRLPAAPLEQRQCRQLKTGVRTDPEGGEPWRQRGLGSGRAGAGHRGCGELARAAGPGCERPCLPLMEPNSGKAPSDPNHSVPMCSLGKGGRGASDGMQLRFVALTNEFIFIQSTSFPAAYWSHSLRSGFDGIRLF